jgi:lysyl-tRNA synthetase class 2
VSEDSESDLPEQLRIRRDKYDRLQAGDAAPYPVSVARTHSLAQVRAEHPDLAAGTRPVSRPASPVE